MIDREEKGSKLDQNEVSTTPKCTVKSFYGKKTTNLRWTIPKAKIQEVVEDEKISNKIDKRHTEKCRSKPGNKTKPKNMKSADKKSVKRTFNNDVHTESCKGPSVNDDKTEEVYGKPVKRFYKRDDMFWTTNVYGKKRKTEDVNTEDYNRQRQTVTNTDSLKIKERTVDDVNTSVTRGTPKKVNCSVETQTSFSSSQDTSSQNTNSSPIVIARSSPFLNDVESKDTSLNESMETNDDVTNSDDSEPYEMFNCDTSSHLNSSFKSDTSGVSPQKKTPKRKKEPNILNYFTKIDKSKSPVEKVTISSHECVKNKEEKKKSSQTQLHFSKSGLSSRNDQDREDDSVLFNLSSTSSTTKTTPRNKKVMKNKSTGGTPKEQMYIDIGQKDFGHVKCETCGMVYTKSQEEDEEQHAKYHQRIVQKLRFNGWKNERVLEEFFDGRIISIKHSDYSMHLKKLNEIREVVDTELGFASSQERNLNQDEQAFLFICSKKVIGCVIAVPITKAYPIIPDSKSESDEKGNGRATQSWCCSTEPVKALCGISRIWAFSQNRRQKIATRLVECIRRNFLYGCIIEKNKLAFSDPTPNGRIFAEKYIGKEDFLVFR